MNIRSYQNAEPRIADHVYIDETAVVIGDVAVGEHSSIWPMSVVRGDVNSIVIGANTNIQDGSILHVTHRHDTIPEGYALHIGDSVTVGHKAVLHGCTIKDQCLIGMGAIVMDGAVIESNVLLGAGSLVPMGKVLESGFLWIGHPVRKSRELTEEEFAWIEYSATHYVSLKNQYITFT
ncbi:MAG: gamma carbonic anhydrase family protein [Gammaproteobacteria bacterium]|nr:gamma carbonic anhydrase family protein [Gammaproteobacteria bacterium]